MKNKYKECELVNNESLTQAQKILIDGAVTMKEAWKEIANIAKSQAEEAKSKEADDM